MTRLKGEIAGFLKLLTLCTFQPEFFAKARLLKRDRFQALEPQTKVKLWGRRIGFEVIGSYGHFVSLSCDWDFTFDTDDVCLEHTGWATETRRGTCATILYSLSIHELVRRARVGVRTDEFDVNKAFILTVWYVHFLYFSRVIISPQFSAS